MSGQILWICSLWKQVCLVVAGVKLIKHPGCRGSLLVWGEMKQIKLPSNLVTVLWKGLISDADCLLMGRLWRSLFLIDGALSSYVRSSSPTHHINTVLQLSHSPDIECVCIHSSGPSPCRGIITLMKSWQAFDLVITCKRRNRESWPQRCQRSLSRQQIPHTITYKITHTHTHAYARTFSP